jgi:ATP-dependent Clp protease ATP-binding subunit ClpC
MFERFTDRARRVIVLAQEEAVALDHGWIGTEHILLGLARDGEGVAGRALTAMGISLDEMRQAVEAIIGRGASPPPESGHIPFTPRAKKVLELSLREAMQLGADHIGTEHILLALIREGDGVAAQVLRDGGVGLDRARRQVTELRAGPPEAGPRPAPAPAAADELVDRLTSIVARLDAIERRLRQSAPG